MANFSVHNTLYEENGGFRLTKEECGILLRKKKSSVVYCPGEGERAPGAMYPRCICLSHNGEKNGTLLATSRFLQRLEGRDNSLCGKHYSGGFFLFLSAFVPKYGLRKDMALSE